MGKRRAGEETEDPTVHSIRLHDAQGGPAEGGTCVLKTWRVSGEDWFADVDFTRIGPSDDQGMLLVSLKPGSLNPEGKLSTGSYKYRLFLFSDEMAGKYVWAPNTTPPRVLELHPTVEVFLKLEGETVRGKPKIAPQEYSFAAMHKKASGGAYTTYAPWRRDDGAFACSKVNPTWWGGRRARR